MNNLFEHKQTAPFYFDTSKSQAITALSKKLLRLPHVLSATGLGRSTLYTRVKDGLWPKPVNLGGRAVGWPAQEVEMINAARICGKTNEEVRQLVMELEAERKIIP